MDTSNLYIRYGEGSAIYLPPYVKVFRSIEAALVEHLGDMGASEIMLPKLVTQQDVQALENANDRFYEEWKHEQLNVYTRMGKFQGYLAHWQCEPIYRVLSTLCSGASNDELHMFFDNSGYSYRNEVSKSPFRFDEFRRIEIFFIGAVDRIRKTRDALLGYVPFLVDGAETRCLVKPDESFGGKEEVVDVEVKTEDGWIEVCGSHVHFTTFLDQFTNSFGKNVVTGCMGISLSRLAMCRSIRTHRKRSQQDKCNVRAGDSCVVT